MPARLRRTPSAAAVVVFAVPPVWTSLDFQIHIREHRWDGVVPVVMTDSLPPLELHPEPSRRPVSDLAGPYGFDASVDFTNARNHGADLGRIRRHMRQAVLAQMTPDTPS